MPAFWSSFTRSLKFSGRALRTVGEHISWHRAVRRRARLDGTTFIGVTGSVGKTMTKALVAAVLSTKYRGGFRAGTHNTVHGVVLSILRRAREGDHFHVVELSGHEPGALDPQLRLARPGIGVVTAIGTDHYSAFGSIEAIAAEKGSLVRSLPSDGVAVLNADDPRVLAMRESCRARVITYGLGAEAMVRAHAVSASWPDPLAFSVEHDGRLVHVRTQLHGTQWISAALAAIATGVALGVDLEASARAVGQVAAIDGRMSPLALPDGTTFVRDDWKAPLHTITPALEFLTAARAPRKIAVIGTIADTFGVSRKPYVDTARRALDAADLVCFVGSQAFHSLRAAPADRPDRLRAFATVKAANQFLAEYLRPGDLILLKGSNRSDHLLRLALARTMPVACWRMDCKRRTYCDKCELVMTPSHGAALSQAPAGGVEESASAVASSVGLRFECGSLSSVLIGLGNPGDAYRGTPHNIGYDVLDRLASTLSAKWTSEPDAAVAVAEWNGRQVWLVKLNAFVNLSGTALRRLAQRTGFTPEHCILIYDDLDLPLGTVRTRMRGSDGGHRGVRSVLEVFQTDQFRRVKIGVKRPSVGGVAKEEVLTPFTDDEGAVVDAALATAHERLRALVSPQPRHRHSAPKRTSNASEAAHES